MIRLIGILLLFFWLTIGLVGCTQVAADSSGDPLVQFAYATQRWGEAENTILQAAIESYMQIADAFILLEPASAVPKSLHEQLSSGMGPDIIIGLELSEMVALADAGLIYELSELDRNLDSYVPQHLEAISYQGKLYGLPFMANTTVLFYNKSQVDSAPTSLDGLLSTAADGQAVAMPINFEQTVWGLTAFGGTLFDPEGELDVTTESYAEWFQWLVRAQNQPGVVLDDDLELLSTKFMEGDVSYLIGPVDMYDRLVAALGEEVLGVAPLPGVEFVPDASNPNATLIRNPAPLFSMKVIAFNKAADRNTLELGLALAEYLNNPTVQRKLIVAGLEQAPTNPRVFIKMGLSEVGNAIVRQSRSGVVIPLSRLAQFQTVRQDANRIYISLLDGGVTADEAAEQMTVLLEEIFEAQ